nr:AP-1 complex subunit sigma-1A isoform X2 [Kogia breviceps]
MRFMLLFSRQGKLRLQKWYLATSDKERKKMVRELMQVVLARKPKMCSFLEWRDLKVVYKRYASLYFCCAIEGQDNELITLELIHRYVELLDKYFGSVCELDIIFNFEKAYFILDEFLMGGDVQDTSKKSVLKAIEQADLLQEVRAGPVRRRRKRTKAKGALPTLDTLPVGPSCPFPTSLWCLAPKAPGWPAGPQALTARGGRLVGVADGCLCQFPTPSPKTQGISSQPNCLCPTLLLAFRVAQRIGEGAHDRSFFLSFFKTHTYSKPLLLRSKILLRGFGGWG